MAAARTLASIWAAKTAARASRALRRGGGTAASGLLGLWLNPSLIRELAAQIGHGCVVVTGTNGKTTTSLLISETARAAGLQPLANGSGSNLTRGIASALAMAVDAGGGLHDADRRLGVFEVDEATLTLALPDLRPRVAVFTNLFRDQLDRYGEVEAVATRWRNVLADAPRELHLVLNADDPAVASLGEGRENVTYFGVEDRKLHAGAPEHASDALFCRCGARLDYAVAFYGHVGHWSCPACGRMRPKPGVAARLVKLGDGHNARFQLESHGEKSTLQLGIGGLYNVYNGLAAAAAAEALDLPRSALETSLTSTGAAFGRQEAFEVGGRRIEVYLGKNPAGLNQVLSTLLLDESRETALIILNDGIADGRDISWVWDADFEVAAGHLRRVIVSGSRAAEMALRLKYAEWDESKIEVVPEVPAALDRALRATPEGGCLTVMPTYTAMLTVRELLAVRAGKEPFWR
jgi:lipid II isoglutaminyl synthase (glutamine-hydrolysing)